MQRSTDDNIEKACVVTNAGLVAESLAACGVAVGDNCDALEEDNDVLNAVLAVADERQNGARRQDAASASDDSEEECLGIGYLLRRCG